jgi:asparagine synthetase B (glutamine-hydrolysing)
MTEKKQIMPEVRKNPKTGYIEIDYAPKPKPNWRAIAEEMAEALRLIKHELTIPAAEYVPAIPAVVDIITSALDKFNKAKGEI